MKLAPVRILFWGGSDGHRARTVGPGLPFLLRGTLPIVQVEALRPRKERGSAQVYAIKRRLLLERGAETAWVVADVDADMAASAGKAPFPCQELDVLVKFYSEVM